MTLSLKTSHPQQLVKFVGYIPAALLNGVGRLGNIFRKRPTTSILVLAVMLLALAGGGLYGYWLDQKNTAVRLLRLEQPAEARKHLTICLRLWPYSPEVHFLAGRAARLTSDFKDATAHLNKCRKLQGDITEETQLEFYLMRVQMGDVDELAPILLAYVDAGHPERALILETIARSYMYNLRLGLAYRSLSRWINLEPSARPYHWRAWVLERLGNSTEALEDYQKALEYEPNLYPVRLRIAEFLLEEYKPQEAVPHLEFLNRAYPNNPEVLARLGHCRMLEGKDAEARPLLEQALLELPKDLPTLHNLAKLDLQDGRLAESRELLHRALKEDPSGPEALYLLHRVYTFEGREKEAAQTLALYNKKSELVKRSNKMVRDEAQHPSNDPDQLAELGDILMQVEREKEGMYWLDQALLREPEHQRAHTVLAEFYERTGRTDKASQHRSHLRKPSQSK